MTGRMECTVCGLAPCDLPDEVDPELIFERVDGQWRCQADANPEPTAVREPDHDDAAADKADWLADWKSDQ